MECILNSSSTLQRLLEAGCDLHAVIIGETMLYLLNPLLIKY